MYIQHQHWEGACDRILIVDVRGHGTVQVDILNTPEGREKYQADALLWALWVDKGKDLYNEPYRRRGEATVLMEVAEDEAKKKGCKSIALEWSLKESPYWVHDWYERLGYEDKEFGKGCALMVKELKQGMTETCRNCVHRERWECGSKIISYCSKLTSNRTQNGKKKVKCNMEACCYYKQK